MRKLDTVAPQGNPSAIFEYFNGPLHRVEAQRASWLDYRIHLRKFETDPSFDNEIAMIEARSRWAAAFKARCS